MAVSEGSKKCFYCGHCNEYLCKTVYFQHKCLHFNKDKNEWLKEARVFQSNIETSQLPFCPSPQLQPSSVASMVTSKSSSCQCSGNSAASLTDSEEDDGRPYNDDEVRL